MRTAIIEHVHLSIAMADHDHRLPADQNRDVVAGFFHLAFVPDIRPNLVEDLRHLHLEDVAIGVDATMDPIGLDGLS